MPAWRGRGPRSPLIERLGAAAAAAAARCIEPVAAWYVGNVLLGTPPPENAAGGRIAFKTGTSYGYRDAWAVGFDGKHTIGVWVGRPDGAPVAGPCRPRQRGADPVRCLRAAGHGAASRCRRRRKACSSRPTAKLPPPLQRFAPGENAGEAMAPKVHIVFPPNGASLELAGIAGEKPDPIAIKITGGTPPLNVLLNGMPLAAKKTARTLFFEPDGPGFVRLTVTDATGAADSVLVRLQ